MTSSTIVLGTAGILLSFLPDEILAYTSSDSVTFYPVILQLLGASYLSFAMLNWMARGNLMGGIYSRPVAIGNLMHFVVAGLALLKGATAGTESTALWIAGGIYGLFAVLFAIVVFTHPVKSIAKASSEV